MHKHHLPSTGSFFFRPGFVHLGFPQQRFLCTPTTKVNQLCFLNIYTRFMQAYKHHLSSSSRNSNVSSPSVARTLLGALCSWVLECSSRFLFLSSSPTNREATSSLLFTAVDVVCSGPLERSSRFLFLSSSPTHRDGAISSLLSIEAWLNAIDIECWFVHENKVNAQIITILVQRQTVWNICLHIPGSVIDNWLFSGLWHCKLSLGLCEIFSVLTFQLRLGILFVLIYFLPSLRHWMQKM